MALKPVGSQQSITTSGSAASSNAISQQTQYIRAVAISNDAYIEVGPEEPNPTATTASFYLVENKPEILSLGSVRAQPVQNLTKGATTIIDFQEGTGSQFVVGDYVTLTAPGQTGFNFTFKEVTAVNRTANYDGFHGTRITVDVDTSSVGGSWNQSLLGSDLRASFKVSALQSGGAGTVKIQQVSQVGDS